MSLSAELFGSDSFIHKLTNIGGLGIPGWLDRKFGTQGPDAQVNGIGAISKQTAKEGDPRAIVWGRVRPIGGNLIHCQAPVKFWVLSYAESGGKGGKKQKQKVYTERVRRTYAIGICEGPISGITRVWRNGTMVYDARPGSAWGAANNHVFLQNARIYLGGWDQLPSPDLQAVWGMDIPAYRGTAYIVFANEDLTELGGAVPQYQFEVERAEGIYRTSKPYAVECEEEAQADTSVLNMRDPFKRATESDELDGTIELEGLSFRTLQYNYDYQEGVDGTVGLAGLNIQSARAIIDPDLDSLNGTVAIQGLNVRVGRFVYQDPVGSENINGTISIQGLSHATA